MENPLAFCGVMCSECPTFKATQTGDELLRKQVADMWSKGFGMTLKPEDIICDGCQTDNGRLFAHCGTCIIRKCCQEKDLNNCGSCTEFSCKDLDAFHSRVPAARSNLERLRKPKK